MAWTSKQKQLAVRACRAAGLSEEQRVDVILRNFDHAHYKGKITSTAPKLTNHDYEHFMSIVERHAGGQLLHFTPGYWQQHADDQYARMRRKVEQLAQALEAGGVFAPAGAGLAGWIEKRVTRGATNRIDALDYHGLLALIIGLQAFARQRGVKVPA